MISFNIFKGGKNKAVTMSFDDGHIYDRRLVELFNKYGIKGTFHLNSKLFGTESSLNGRTRLEACEVKELYKGHEVSCHATKHDTLTQLPSQEIAKDVLEDRNNLETLCGYPVRGMSYPNGAYDKRVIEVLRSCGIEYSRTVKSHGEYYMPDDFLEWHPTCHYRNALELAKAFAPNPRPGRMLYIWGHGYEIEESKYDWAYMEEVCRILAADKDNIWFATNIEIVDYVNAQKSLKITADGKTVYNPSVMEVWFRYNGTPVSIKGGETLQL